MCTVNIFSITLRLTESIFIKFRGTMIIPIDQALRIMDLYMEIHTLEHKSECQCTLEKIEHTMSKDLGNLNVVTC